MSPERVRACGATLAAAVLTLGLVSGGAAPARGQEPTGSLEVTVYRIDPNERVIRPASGEWVVVGLSQEPGSDRTVKTDATGRVQLDDLPPGTFLVYGRGFERLATVEAGKTAQVECTAVQYSALGLALTRWLFFIDSETREPVAGASVKVKARNGESPAASRSGTTDGDGRAELPPGLTPRDILEYEAAHPDHLPASGTIDIDPPFETLLDELEPHIAMPSGLKEPPARKLPAPAPDPAAEPASDPVRSAVTDGIRLTPLDVEPAERRKMDAAERLEEIMKEAGWKRREDGTWEWEAPPIPMTRLQPTQEANPGTLYFIGAGDLIDEDLDFTTSVDTFRTSFGGIVIEEGTETEDPARLAEQFGMSFSHDAYGFSAAYALPVYLAPTVFAEAGLSKLDLLYDNREGPSTRWTGNGFSVRAGLRELVPLGNKAFLLGGYDYERISGAKVTRSPALQAEGVSVLRDEGRLDYSSHTLQGRIGLRTRCLAPYVGGMMRWTNMSLDGDVSAQIPFPEGLVQNDISFVNRFESRKAYGLLGLDARLPGTRFFLRGQAATDGSNWSFTVNLAYGTFPGR